MARWDFGALPGMPDPDVVLAFAEFDRPMRAALVECCEFNWSRISPAVFGSLFQSIMAGDAGARTRRQLGAHYTSERDIMKLVKSLFLDDLQKELLECGKSKRRLQTFQQKLASLRFLDPACGCGNFLVVTYRELRLLELEVLIRLWGGKEDSARLMLDALLKVDVDQMHGIEIEEWPARIAEVAMWLIDHQMNQKVGEAFGQPVRRLPLTKSARIVHANALRTDWNEVLASQRCSYVLGNPPFVGKKERNRSQKADMTAIWGDVAGAGVLDYVTCWYRVAARYIVGSGIGAAFVSTNSICQGEQVGLFWPQMLGPRGMSIRFAHTTFVWMSEAKGKAHVHVVIVGFGAGTGPGTIVDYSDDATSPTVSRVARISPYLCEGSNLTLVKRRAPLCNVPPMNYGSMMIDRGRDQASAKGLLLSAAERAAILNENRAIAPFVRPLFGTDEFINGTKRWCLWLVDAPPNLVRSSRLITERLDAVRRFRSSSDREQTQKLAATPGLFGEIRQPATDYLLVPKVSSENRRYIPIGFMSPAVIASGSALVVPNATLYHFGVLTSEMHMAWTRRVCGRLESRYQYSANLVYNNFPWPETSAIRMTAVESAARHVLDCRALFGGQTLADLYDPLAMPKVLRDAHRSLDLAVDRCYRAARFAGERQRVEYLFTLYECLISPLTSRNLSRRSGTQPIT